MTEEERKEKLLNQKNEQYLAIGKFAVKFEHLIDAIKLKIKMLCGNREEIAILIEPLLAAQTIEMLNNLVEWKIKDFVNEEEKGLYLKLLQDLKTLNTKRNSYIHTMWFIGWVSDKTTDATEFDGRKFITTKKKTWKKLTANDINSATQDCEMFYQIMYTSWSIDIFPIGNVPPFHEFYSRARNGKWNSLRN